MDYLDPKKRHAHRVRILVGYGLMAVAIAIATVIMVFLANGYYIDRDTGEVIQNGLVYVDSKPGGANVYIDGSLQGNKTDARLVIPDGNYTIGLSKEGYRDWSRNLQLEGGSLRRLTYARLIPKTLSSTLGVNLRENPVSLSQSPDKRWMVVGFKDSPLSFGLIDLETSPLSVQVLAIPKNLVSHPDTGIVKFLEWDGGNRYVLLKYSTDTSKDYLLIDRINPSLSQNITTIIGNTSADISMLDRNFNRFFVYDPASKDLFTATTSGGIDKVPFAKAVERFKTFGTDWLLYVTPSKKSGLVEARFKRGNNDILLKELKSGPSYLLQLAKLGNAPVMAISSTIENRVIVYNDPQDYLNKNSNVSIPVATTVLRVMSPSELTISADSSVVLAYGPENVASHEFDADRSYNYKLEVPIDIQQKTRWLDGQHLIFGSTGVQYSVDFDGSNTYELVNSIASDGSIFNKSGFVMYSLRSELAQSDSSAAVPSAVMVTNLLIPADQ